MNSLTQKILALIEEDTQVNLNTTWEDIRGVDSEIIDYKLKNDKIVSETLLNIQRASITLYKVSEGEQFPENVHHEPVLYELITVLDGELEIAVNNKRIIAGELETIKINRDEPHAVIAKKDSIIIAITIPNEDTRFYRQPSRQGGNTEEPV